MALSNEYISQIKALAKSYGYLTDKSQAVILGLIDQESAGHVTWLVNGKRVPAIRPETHKFYKYLSGTKRDLAVKQGLAAKKAGAINIPNNYTARYAFFERMKQIDETAALMSISMGLGQVMGFNYKMLGFSSVQQQWQRANEGVSGQVELILKYIEANPPLVTAINAQDFDTIARLYNGPEWRKNDYSNELRAHTALYMPGVPVINRDIERVYDTAEYADRIKALGYKDVKDFQTENALNPDGIIGRLTISALKDAEAKGIKQLNKPADTSGKVAVGGTIIGTIAAGATQIGSAVEAVKPALDTIGTAGKYGPTIVAIVCGVVVIGAVGAFIYWKVRNARVA